MVETGPDPKTDGIAPTRDDHLNRNAPMGPRGSDVVSFGLMRQAPESDARAVHPWHAPNAKRIIGRDRGPFGVEGLVSLYFAVRNSIGSAPPVISLLRSNSLPVLVLLSPCFRAAPIAAAISHKLLETNGFQGSKRAAGGAFLPVFSLLAGGKQAERHPLVVKRDYPLAPPLPRP